jgi:hypothetical protein
VIPADLGAELAIAVGELASAGYLPASATSRTAAGTWRPAPPAPVAAGRGPAAGGASYATSLPFDLARLAGRAPADVAARLAPAVRRAGWVTSAEPTGPGYLTIGVTAAALAAVAVRVTEAGPACVRSDALRGDRRPAPPLPDLAAAASWRQAWRDQAAALSGRLARAAGATLVPPDGAAPDGAAPGAAAPGDAAPEGAAPEGDVDGGDVDGGAGPAGDGTVAAAVAYAGADAVRYWLARMPAARAGRLSWPASVTRDPARPEAAVPYSAPPYLARDLAAVSFARADAAATGRWAAELGLARLGPPDPGRLAGPAEIELLTQLSWLAERVAAAGRRQPDGLPRYLERLAAAWLDCRDSCPALPFGGHAAPGDAAGVSARLWLARAAATALAAGLGLVGVGPAAGYGYL